MILSNSPVTKMFGKFDGIILETGFRYESTCKKISRYSTMYTYKRDEITCFRTALQ